MNRFEHYQKHQTFYEIGLLALFMTLNALVLSTTSIMDMQRQDASSSFAYWEPFVWEFSSAAVSIMLVPGVLWLLGSKYSLWRGMASFVFIYLLASIVFSLLHILGMVVLRKFAYWMQGSVYDFGDPIFGFVYEYRKDLISFILIIGVLQAYRFIMSRLKGEASLVKNGEGETANASFDRVLVKKLGKEFIVKIDEVEWLEASGNYVNLYVDGRIYPSRNTLTKFVQNISDKGFCQVHRSYAVNLDAVESIAPRPSGSSEVVMKGGKVLSLSRRYHDELKSRMLVMEDC